MLILIPTEDPTLSDRPLVQDRNTGIQVILRGLFFRIPADLQSLLQEMSEAVFARYLISVEES